MPDAKLTPLTLVHPHGLSASEVAAHTQEGLTRKTKRPPSGRSRLTREIEKALLGFQSWNIISVYLVLAKKNFLPTEQ
jgi:hypothetical protein